MKLNFTFKHLDRSEALEAYTSEKLDHVSRFLLKDGMGTVCFSKKNHEFELQVSVNTRARYFRAEAYNNDPYQAVDEACEKLERQFLKIKSTVQHHKSKEKSKRGRLNQLTDRLELKTRFRKAA